MTFQVKACGQVQLALSSYPGVPDVNAYMIGIGVGQYNTEVNIVHEGEVKATQNLLGVLICDTFMNFWVSWHNGIIQVGRGSVQSDVHIIGWQHDEPHDVNVVAMTTDADNDGVWQFVRLKGT